MKLTLTEYWMARDVKYAAQLTPEIRRNAAELLGRVNRCLAVYGGPAAVSSGWRPPEVNAATPNSAKRSRHMTGQAVDLVDVDGRLKRWCRDNLEQLVVNELWMEAPESTPTWVHWQSIPPKSGNRVFKP